MSIYNPADNLSVFVAPKYTEASNLVDGGNVFTSRDNTFTGNNDFTGKVYRSSDLFIVSFPEA